jgi:hypothetical protein
MTGDYKLCVAASISHGCGGKASFGAFTAGKNEFAIAYRQVVKLGRIIQAEEAAFHRATGCKFREDRSNVAARALNAAGGVQLRKYADEHSVSLPRAAMESKRDT